MRKNRFYLLLLVLLINCQENKSQSVNKKAFEIVNKIPAEKRISYAVHVNALTPYELYLDDILIDFFYEDNMNNTTELNPYLLENGKHKLKIRYLPTVKDMFSKKGLLDPRDIYTREDSRWHVFFVKLNKDPNVPLGYTNEIDYGSSELKIIPPPSQVPYWEQEWELDIKDLPYKLKGWSESEDLSKMDKDQLKKEVVAYYEKQRNLLNNGSINEFLKLSSKQDEELDICTYTTPEQSRIDYDENVELMSKLCPNNMQPMDNYTMKLYANGKLVSLEIPNGKYKSWSALMSKTPKGRVNEWSIKLHKPKGSKDFEIIRK
ncbi:hypothetical protein VUJ46_00945 [Chryseobacterium sp. MYb264]|uniref:hypothetical protein n=1 Tax=Chryseobacterium sp. MYb264 TaxID=2745153 RepID=UPI002E12AD22|nr:hypothetical protein VUJ46_00945 [Chryseobacterium sp. MYb264]